MLLRERKAAALAGRGRGNHKVTALRAADGLDAGLAEPLAKDRLAGSRAGRLGVEVAVGGLRPLSDLCAADGLDDRALVDPVREGVEGCRLGTGEASRGRLRLVAEGLERADLVLEVLADLRVRRLTAGVTVRSHLCLSKENRQS